MPSYLRGQLRNKQVYVTVNPVLLYGFAAKDIAGITGVGASDVAALGHLTPAAAAGTAGAILCLGLNAPKPARVTKKLSNAITAQSSVSTFASHTALGTALTAGWRIAKGIRGASISAGGTGKRSLTAIATLSNGALYAFAMNAADYTAYSAPLGLTSAAEVTTDAERRKVVRGATRPRPGQASIELAISNADTVTGYSTFSSFYSTDAPLTGFNRLSEEDIIPAGAAPANP